MDEPDDRTSGGDVRDLRSWIHLVLSVALAIGGVLFCFRFIAKPFSIPTPSMERTLLVGDRVVVVRFWYRIHDVERGDIVVFSPPGVGSEVRPRAKTRADDITFIKRVVALPGEWVGGRQGQVWICPARPNGRAPLPPTCTALAEPYVSSDQEDFSFRRVPDSAVWVMGDNRADSEDSRIIGPVPLSAVSGRAFVRYWPPGRAGSIPAPRLVVGGPDGDGT